MSVINSAPVDFKDELIAKQTTWIRSENSAAYDLNTPNRVVRQNYSRSEMYLASPPSKRHILGIVGGNDVSQLAGNPQDIESDLRGLTRPLTNCPEREYHPTKAGQEKLVYDNRKTNLSINIRPIHLPEYQMWAYPTAYAPLPLRKETCGRPEKY